MDISEFELIRRIVKQIPRNLREAAQLQDDTAVLRPPRTFRQLLTTDVIVEQVDFLLKTARPEEIGKKALAVNLSDIAAMGGTPEYFTIALGIPSAINAAWIKRFYTGLLVWARRFHVGCAGGDISKSGRFFASVTVLGKTARKPIQRNGAKAGDWIGVTGSLGGSLQSGHHLNFKPRVEEGRFLADNSIHAMLDISDGLMQDLEHILSQSRVGCELETGAIPIAAAALKEHRNKDAALRAALTDGEDFELLFTASPAVRERINAVWKMKFPQTRLSWIGRVCGPSAARRWLKNGKIFKSPDHNLKGFQHFK